MLECAVFHVDSFGLKGKVLFLRQTFHLIGTHRWSVLPNQNLHILISIEYHCNINAIARQYLYNISTISISNLEPPVNQLIFEIQEFAFSVFSFYFETGTWEIFNWKFTQTFEPFLSQWCLWSRCAIRKKGHNWVPLLATFVYIDFQNWRLFF